MLQRILIEPKKKVFDHFVISCTLVVTYEYCHSLISVFVLNTQRKRIVRTKIITHMVMTRSVLFAWKKPPLEINVIGTLILTQINRIFGLSAHRFHVVLICHLCVAPC